MITTRIAVFLKIVLIGCLFYVFGGEREIGRYLLLSQETANGLLLPGTHGSPASVLNMLDTPFVAVQEHTVLNTFQDLSRGVQKIPQQTVGILSLSGFDRALRHIYLQLPSQGIATIEYYIFALRKMRI